MKNEHKPDELLSAVFTEAAPADFRRASLGKTLQQVQHRHRQKRMVRAAVLLALLAAFALLIRPQRSGPIIAGTARPTVKVHSNYHLVSTQPLPKAAVVTTHPLASTQVIDSIPTASFVRTRRGNYRTLNDDELLALVSHRPIALIRLNETSESLLFVNPADENGFPVP